MTLSWASYGNTEEEVNQFPELITNEKNTEQSSWAIRENKREITVGAVMISHYTRSGKLLITGDKEEVCTRVDEYKRFIQKKQLEEGGIVDIGLKTRRR